MNGKKLMQIIHEQTHVHVYHLFVKMWKCCQSHTN